MTRRKHLALWLAPVVVLIGAIAVATMLMFTREPPAQGEARAEGRLVEVIDVQRKSHRLDVEVQGSVIPARRVAIQPQIPGRLVWVHPNLVPGGVIRAGEPLLRIDDADYRLALAQQQTRIAEAKAQLQLEQGRGKVAEREWALFADELGDTPRQPDLALREPQLQAARAQLEAARAQLQQAELELSRTEVTAPFDALVEREQAALGQLVSAQAEVASLVGVEHFWLEVAVAMDRLPHIAIPGVTADEGALVRIQQHYGDQVIQRQGQVIQLRGSLNPQGRMARLLIRIDDPLGLKQAEPGARGLPLMLDAYVNATILGRQTRDLVELPRRALREGAQAYVVTPEGTLAVRELEIAWRQQDSVLVQTGVREGERVVVSPLANAYEGMPVRLTETSQAGRDNP